MFMAGYTMTPKEPNISYRDDIVFVFMSDNTMTTRLMHNTYPTENAEWAVYMNYTIIVKIYVMLLLYRIYRL